MSRREDDVYAKVGRRIREERLSRGWTQEELAEKSGLHLSFIGQIERGVKEVSLRTLKRIADELGVRAASLIEETAPAAKAVYTYERKLTEFLRERSLDEQKLMYDTVRMLARQRKKAEKKA